MPSPELHIAVIAGKRLFIIVYERMRFQLIRIAETRIAYCAYVRTFPRMYPLMTTQIGNLNEISLTEAALIRLLACVKPYMCFQMMVPCKSDKRKNYVITNRPPPPASPLHLLKKSFSLSKISGNLPFLACRTYERFFAGMCALVILQYVLVSERSGACRANKCLLWFLRGCASGWSSFRTIA